MITTEVTWADLRSAYDDELADLRDAYDELTEQAREEYGEDWQDRPMPRNPDALGDDERDLWVYQQQAAQYDQAAQSIQKRQHMLDRLADEYGDGDFEIKMLTGEETMQIETELRTLAQERGIDVSVIQVRRNALTVDKATVDAPEGVPREDGSPVPSECPNALTLALWDQVEAFNNAGETGFRAAGFGDHSPPDQTPGSSATPTASATSSTDSPE
jgi:hypothetical protein